MQTGDARALDAQSRLLMQFSVDIKTHLLYIIILFYWFFCHIFHSFNRSSARASPVCIRVRVKLYTLHLENRRLKIAVAAAITSFSNFAFVSSFKNKVT